MSTWALLLGAFGLRRRQSEEPIAEPATPVVAAPEPVREPVFDRVPVLPRRRKDIATYAMTDQFVRWMQDERATGYWLVDEIDELREAFCDRFGYTVPCPYEFRSYLAHTPGCSKGVHRLKGWEFQAVSRRTTIERPTLYKIHSRIVQETVSSGYYQDFRGCQSVSDDCRSVTVTSRQNAGKGPVKHSKQKKKKQNQTPETDLETRKSSEIEERVAA